jgi:hypothetical protein
MHSNACSADGGFKYPSTGFATALIGIASLKCAVGCAGSNVDLDQFSNTHYSGH